MRYLSLIDLDDLELSCCGTPFNFFPRFFWENFKHKFPALEEKDGKLLIETEIPGFNKEEIKAVSKNGYLEITANKNESNKKRSFEAMYSLPEEINFETEPSATYENGVLKLSFDILKEEKQKKSLEKIIEIK